MLADSFMSKARIFSIEGILQAFEGTYFVPLLKLVSVNKNVQNIVTSHTRISATMSKICQSFKDFTGIFIET